MRYALIATAAALSLTTASHQRTLSAAYLAALREPWRVIWRVTAYSGPSAGALLAINDISSTR